MPITQHTVGGLVYNAIGTAAWQGSEGEQLRADGWVYCGYGTYGIYVTRNGQPCGTPVASTPQEPEIMQPPPDQPGVSNEPIGAVTDKACGGCRSKAPRAPAPSGSPPPTTPGAPAPVVMSKKGCPWWLIAVIVVLTIKVLGDGRNT